MGQSQRYQAAVDGHAGPELHWHLPGRSSDRASGVGILSPRQNIPRTLGGCPWEPCAVIAPFSGAFFFVSALTRHTGKLVFEKCCHCETSAHTGRGNPPVEWNQVAITTKNRRSSHFLGAIRYISPLTGGLPHQSADWFAMTGYFEAKPFKHQFAGLPGESD